ncbi:ATP cone domain-containing protein [Zavarzinella formosa]|uniref:ATP cone domain-containing protein n=1 Tax=Zavarzinella formosa TaxID=360055 RepID=UPI0002F13880|nr:ATP cone domain-containing protein [Zavarzinella formosa]
MEATNPEFVRHADGTVEPFEPERITRSLFKVAERLGTADAFLARELTESITHFLEAGGVGGTVSTSEIADTVVRVVRELGLPALAKAYEERGQRPPVPALATAVPIPSPVRLTRRHAAGRAEDIGFSLKHLYPRELVAAHDEGLITLDGLSAPMELSGRVADEGLPLLDRLRDVGEHLADDRLDWPTRELGEPAVVAFRYFQSLRELAQVGDVRVSGHFRIPGGEDQSFPPAGLFPSEPRPSPEHVRELHRHLAMCSDEAIGWHWHLSATSPEEQLPWLGPTPEHWKNAEFVFDHPKRPAWLGPGLTRESKAALVRVGINLERLLGMLGGWPVDVPTLLAKAAALARFAKTAGHVKQDWLRKHGDERLRKAFLLDRATVVIVPLGLSAIIGHHSLLNSEIPRQLLATIRNALETDRPRQIPTAVDSDWEKTGVFAELPAGATRNDWKAAGQLCQAANGGLVVCHLEGRPEEGIEILKLAARSGIHRLRFTS